VPLTVYAAYHAAFYIWFYASGGTVRLSYPPAVASWPGAGAVVALAASVLALAISLMPRSTAPPDA
jgi:hypothetical protein